MVAYLLTVCFVALRTVDEDSGSDESLKKDEVPLVCRRFEYESVSVFIIKKVKVKVEHLI